MQINSNAWITLYVNCNNATYFGSFGIDHIPKEIKKLMANKDITTNIYIVQAYDSFVLDLLILCE